MLSLTGLWRVWGDCGSMELVQKYGKFQLRKTTLAQNKKVLCFLYSSYNGDLCTGLRRIQITRGHKTTCFGSGATASLKPRSEAKVCQEGDVCTVPTMEFLDRT